MNGEIKMDEPRQASNEQGVEWTRGKWDRRCVATKRTGEQCRNWAIRGGAVCRYHGGSTAHIKKKARERIEQAQDLVAMRMIGFAVDEGVPPHVALAAAKDILDRGGTSTPTEVEVTVRPYEELLGDVAHVTRAQHEAMKRGEFAPAPVPELPPGEVVDAEIVEDAPVSRPERVGERADCPDVPSWAEPPPAAPPSRELVTMEEAAADVAAANRAARVSKARRRR